MSDHFDTHIVARFSRLFGDPPTDQFEAYVADYRKALGGVSAAILQEASDLVVKRHRYRNWPTIGECVEAVNEVADRRAEECRVVVPDPPRREPTAEEKARVDRLVKQCTAAINPLKHKPTPGRLQASDRIAWEARFGRRA